MNALPQPMPLQTCDATQTDAFRLAMRQLAAGVSVITTGQGEDRAGLTATSVSSLSMDPPCLIVCINKTSSVLPMLTQYRCFGVNFLAANQRRLANTFSGKSGLRGAQRFAEARWIESATGAPLLSDALSGIDCAVEQITEWHSHAIVIGRVMAVRLNGGSHPLVYWRGDYMPA